MGALLRCLRKPADDSEHVAENMASSITPTPSEESANHEINEHDEVFPGVFMPKDTLDQPCDVILVVEDGKQFKVHRQVLSEASPFFEKMLSSDMKESKEGIVRLEMFSESVMGNALEFIYTGSVQILTEDNARDLIVIADYLFLHNLKTLAEEVFILQNSNLNTSNCISTYYFSQRYRCEGLFAKTKTFILANFSAICAANPEEVLNMSSKEIEMWISSDEVDVSAEEDVFKIILAWIDHDRSKRKVYFAELFRQVRLAYISRDFLSSDIVTNDLVKDNEGCLDLVEDAMRLIDSKDFDNLVVKPRKSFETPVIVSVFLGYGKILCHFPREGWAGRLHSLPVPRRPSFDFDDVDVLDLALLDLKFVCCRDKLYSWESTGQSFNREHETSSGTLSYINLYSRRWRSLPAYKEKREVHEIFVSNDELYALMYEPCSECGQRLILRIPPCDNNKHVSFISKYKPESNLWEDLSSFDDLALRRNSCIVAKDNFIYFIGGELGQCKYCTDVDRYDLSSNKWTKIAHMQKARSSASGAVAYGKLFVAGGTDRSYSLHSCEWEVYNGPTNQWHFITTPMRALDCSKLLSVDGKLYAYDLIENDVVDCYGSDKNLNRTVIDIPGLDRSRHLISCSMRIFKGFLTIPQRKENGEEGWEE